MKYGSVKWCALFENTIKNMDAKDNGFVIIAGQIVDEIP